MKRSIATACVLVMTSGVTWAWQMPPATVHNPPPAVQGQPTATPPAKTVAKKKKKTAAKKPSSKAAAVAPVPAQEMPPVPATLMNAPPVKPSVTMDNGKLTIDAPNSTLSDVLSGVHQATGAVIEGASPSERVAVKLGPGIPEQVIAALLRGTAYDYVILGTVGRQDTIARVVLTQQTASAGGSQPTQRPAAVQLPQGERGGFGEGEQPPRGPAEEDNGAQPENQADQPAPPSQPQQPQDSNPKSPEQLYKELQQLEQQKQPR